MGHRIAWRLNPYKLNYSCLTSFAVVGDMILSKVMNCLLLFQENGDDKKDKSKDKKKVVVKTIELPIDAQTHGFPQNELHNYFEQEVCFDHSCRLLTVQSRE